MSNPELAQSIRDNLFVLNNQDVCLTIWRLSWIHFSRRVTRDRLPIQFVASPINSSLLTIMQGKANTRPSITFDSTDQDYMHV
jgi:hypothetical protein